MGRGHNNERYKICQTREITMLEVFSGAIFSFSFRKFLPHRLLERFAKNAVFGHFGDFQAGYGPK